MVHCGGRISCHPPQTAHASPFSRLSADGRCPCSTQASRLRAALARIEAASPGKPGRSCLNPFAHAPVTHCRMLGVARTHMRQLLHRDGEGRLFALKRLAGAHRPGDSTARCTLRCRVRPCPRRACPVTRALPAGYLPRSCHPLTHGGSQCARRCAHRHPPHRHRGQSHRHRHLPCIGVRYGRRTRSDVVGGC